MWERRFICYFYLKKNHLEIKKNYKKIIKQICLTPVILSNHRKPVKIGQGKFHIRISNIIHKK